MLFNFQGSSLRLQGLYSTISSSVCQELFFLHPRSFFAPGVPRETASLIYHTPYPKVNTFFVFLFFFFLTCFLYTLYIVSVPRSFPLFGFFIPYFASIYNFFWQNPFNRYNGHSHFVSTEAFPWLTNPMKLRMPTLTSFPQKIAEKAAHSIADFYKVNAGDVGHGGHSDWKTAGALALAITLSVRLLLLPNRCQALTILFPKTAAFIRNLSDSVPSILAWPKRKW